LNPTILGENKAMELLSKVLNHVIPLRLAVDQEVNTDPLLETNYRLDFLLDELFVLFLSDFLLVELRTSRTDFFSLLNPTMLVIIRVSSRRTNRE
jgi:hypothetical protein